MRVVLASGLTSEFIDGVLHISIEASGDDEQGQPGTQSGMPPAQPLGLACVPRDAERDEFGRVKSAPQCLVLEQGDDCKAMPLTDPVMVGGAPQGTGGSFCATTTSGLTSYYYMDGKTGYHQALCKYTGDGEERSLSFSMDCAADEPKIEVIHGKGNAFRLFNDGSILMTSADGTSYVHVQNNKKIVINGDLQVNGSVLGGGETGRALALAADVQLLRDLINTILTVGLVVNIGDLTAKLPPGVITLTPAATPLNGSTKMAGAD